MSNKEGSDEENEISYSSQSMKTNLAYLDPENSLNLPFALQSIALLAKSHDPQFLEDISDDQIMMILDFIFFRVKTQNSDDLEAQMAAIAEISASSILAEICHISDGPYNFLTHEDFVVRLTDEYPGLLSETQANIIHAFSKLFEDYPIYKREEVLQPILTKIFKTTKLSHSDSLFRFFIDSFIYDGCYRKGIVPDLAGMIRNDIKLTLQEENPGIPKEAAIYIQQWKQLALNKKRIDVLEQYITNDDLFAGHLLYTASHPGSTLFQDSLMILALIMEATDEFCFYLQGSFIRELADMAKIPFDGSKDVLLGFFYIFMTKTSDELNENVKHFVANFNWKYSLKNSTILEKQACLQFLAIISDHREYLENLELGKELLDFLDEVLQMDDKVFVKNALFFLDNITGVCDPGMFDGHSIVQSIIDAVDDIEYYQEGKPGKIIYDFVCNRL